MKYRVLQPVTYGSTADNGRRYEPGETVEMPPAIGDGLADRGILEKVAEAPKPAPAVKAEKSAK